MSKRTSWQRRVPEGNSVSFSEKKTLIRALTMSKLQQDDYHLLSRKQQFILVRHRTGHNRMNSHMHRKLKLAPSPTCPCGQEEQTTEHVLQRCPLYKATREDVWPVSTSLTTKLCSGKQELEKTTSFISRVALIVLTVKKKKKRNTDGERSWSAEDVTHTDSAFKLLRTMTLRVL